jgi:hypothetical protein
LHRERADDEDAMKEGEPAVISCRNAASQITPEEPRLKRSTCGDPRMGYLQLTIKVCVGRILFCFHYSSS